MRIRISRGRIEVWGAVLGALLCGLTPVRALDTNKDLTQCQQYVWTTREGLPAHAINAIAQTPDGYLWLATHAGLFRFDGVTFTYANSWNAPGAKPSEILSLAVSKAGELWIGTNGDGFGRLRNGVYERIKLGRTDQSWYDVRSIYTAQDGSLWFSGEGSATMVRVKDGVATNLTSTRLPYVPTHQITQDRQGDYWLATYANGLIHLRRDGSFRQFRTQEGLPSNELSALCFDRDGALWIGTTSSGLCRYKQGRFHTFTKRDGLSSDIINTLYQDRQGNLWIGTANGINRRQRGQFTAFRKADGLSNMAAGPMLEDREGNLWVGSGAGLNRFCNTKLTPLEFHSEEGASGIEALRPGVGGSVWIAANDGLRRVRGTETRLFTTRDGLPGNHISSILEARDGTLWVLCRNGRIARYRNGAFHTLPGIHAFSDVMEDKQGVLFVGPYGLYRYAPPRFLLRISAAQIGYIFMSYRDRSGALWLACNGGFGKVQNDHIEWFNQGLAPHTDVQAITEDGAGGFWLGTDSGLSHFRNGRHTLYTTRDGLPDNVLFQVLTDNNGGVWAGCTQGIFALKTQDIAAFEAGRLPTIPATFYKADAGIRDFPFRYGALKTPDGRLWFRGEEGLTIVTPTHLPICSLKPTVCIEKLLINAKEQPLQGAIRLPPGAREVEFRYTALSLTDPGRVRFRYRLEGYDKDWVDAGTRRAAFYTNLPPGNYVFQVIACNHDGIWNTEGATLRFTLRPFFWQTWWFKSLGILLGAGLIVVGVRLRLRQLQRRNREL